MVDSEYITEDYESPEISIEAMMKNSKMPTFVPDHLKGKKCVNMQLRI